jgi:hypothetical protein
VRPAPALAALQARCRDAVASLPRGVCVLVGRPEPYPVQVSPALDALVERATAAVSGGSPS